MTPLVQVPAVPEQNTKALAAIDQAKAFNIATPEEYAVVDAFCVSLKALEKEVDLAYDEHIDAAHKAHKALVAKKKLYAEPIAEARKIAKGKLIAYDEKRESERKFEEARLRAEAQKRAEDEALAKAAMAEEYGDTKGAEAIISAPVVAAPVSLAQDYPKAKTTVQTRWTYKIVNPAMIPREYLIPDETKIGGVIRATKGAVQIPGVEAVQVKV